ncbi:uncharacterized protein Z518_01804 [Rhinocladiella mackenziei CBS 650.93]|uniref:Uncharacterized protein n=1 Tax=Rhinocladiella mackenziei CBS 650.93 TaxID=1442369 RepID=A0A0D2JML1_9EURO|nr:uncharacterized protein Z518_01804 [Rhinocladiella mackenziei CBS 650.93]KIX10720.1 hypothetical protein Z518_01804 [Rhinocladiella mackenziei CBS 650.93]
MDDILLPIIYEYYSSSHVQHYPSSYDHSRYNATARGVETRGQRIDPISREQQLMSYLPPEQLPRVWESILIAVQRPAFRQFRDITILLQAKNLKVLTKDTTWERMMTRFSQYWFASRVASSIRVLDTQAELDDHRDHSETLLWKRCCLENWKLWIQQGPAQDSLSLRVTRQTSRLRDEDFRIWMDDILLPIIYEYYSSSHVQHYPSSYDHSRYNATARGVETRGQRIDPISREQQLMSYLPPEQLPRVWESILIAVQRPAFRQFRDVTILLQAKNLKVLTKDTTWERMMTRFSQYWFASRVASSIRVLDTQAELDDHRDHSETLLWKRYCLENWKLWIQQGPAQDSLSLRVTRFRLRPQHHRLLTCSSGVHAPYYRFTTATLIRWLRWNINKFCVGFEMVHSFQDAHFVTWEHTRIMLAFLRCLQFSCPSGLIQKVGGCWHDVRFRPDSRQADGLQRVEGLGFRRTMEEFGYGWFLDKIDWVTLTFRPPHAAHMMFNNPSMQAAYHARYGQVRDVRLDFIRMDHARQWMIEFSAVSPCLDVLEKFLRQLCLYVFRKDVFSHIKSILDPESAPAALAGEIPLCYASVEKALQKKFRPPSLAHGHRLAVKSIDVLFSWLWEWKDGQFERQGWDDKPYRMLFRQSYYAVTTARGQARARTWRQELKKSFIRSHWMMPYPQKNGFMRKDKDTKDFVWWPSYHAGLHTYYRQFSSHTPLPNPLPTSYIKHHPGEGWRLAPQSWDGKYMPYVVQPEQRLLHLSESELYQELVRLREQWVAEGERSSSRSDIAVMPILEFNCRSQNYIGPRTEWCSRRREWVVKPFEKCRTAGECSIFLRQELEKYEILQHQRQDRRRRRGKKRRDFHSDSESDLSSRSDDITSDEDSLEARRRRQGQVVKRMEARMRELMEREEKEWEKRRERYRPEDTVRWRRPGEYLEKEFNHRLRQVK